MHADKNIKEMIHDFWAQHSTEIGTMGVVVGTIMPILNEFLAFMSRGFSLLTAMGGLVLIVYSVKLKKMEHDRMKKDLDGKN